MVNGAHKPELDNLTTAQIRVLCEELLYTMDYEQRAKISSKFPGLYLMVFDRLPDGVRTQLADELSEFRSHAVKQEEFKRMTDCVETVARIA